MIYWNTNRIVNGGHKKYPLPNLLRHVGNSLKGVGTLMCSIAIIIEIICLAMEDGLGYVFSDASFALYYFVVGHNFTYFTFIIFLIPIGCILSMVARILTNIKDDPMRCRLTLKYIVQEYSEKEMYAVNMGRDEYVLEDMIYAPRPEVSDDGRP